MHDFAHCPALRLASTLPRNPKACPSCSPPHESSPLTSAIEEDDQDEMLQLYENAAAELEAFTEHLRVLLVAELLMQNVSPAEKLILKRLLGLDFEGKRALRQSPRPPRSALTGPDLL